MIRGLTSHAPKCVIITLIDDASTTWAQARALSVAHRMASEIYATEGSRYHVGIVPIPDGAELALTPLADIKGVARATELTEAYNKACAMLKQFWGHPIGSAL